MLPGVDERIRRTVERLAEEVDPGDALVRVRRKKARRYLARRMGTAALAIAVLAATGGGIFALARLFGLGQPRPVAVPPERNLAFVSDRDGDAEIYVLGDDGRPAKLTDNDVDDQVPTWSPDGTRIAFLRREGGAFHVYVMNSDGTASRAVTRVELTGVVAGRAGGGLMWFSRRLSWSADGTRIAFAGVEVVPCPAGACPNNMDTDIFSIHVDGTGLMNLTDTTGADEGDPAWSPDGATLAFARENRSSPPGGSPQLYSMTTESPRARRLTDLAGGAAIPAWSPDGTMITFEGDGDVYVMSADGSGLRAFVSLNSPGAASAEPRPNYGNYEPSFSPDGTDLVFVSDRDGDRDLYVMPAGGPGDETVRLTDLPGNESFPAGKPATTPAPSASVSAGPSPSESLLPTTPSASSTATPPPPSPHCLGEAARRNAPPPADPSKVAVYFSCIGDLAIDPEPAYMLERTLPDPQASLEGRLEFALDQLLRGPSAAEEERGYVIAVAPFRDGIRGIEVSDGHATVDMTGAFQRRTQCCETTQGIIFETQLLATVFQFDEIRSVRFLSGGDCDAFWHHFETSCHDLER